MTYHRLQHVGPAGGKAHNITTVDRTGIHETAIRDRTGQDSPKTTFCILDYNGPQCNHNLHCATSPDTVHLYSR